MIPFITGPILNRLSIKSRLTLNYYSLIFVLLNINFLISLDVLNFTYFVPRESPGIFKWSANEKGWVLFNQIYGGLYISNVLIKVLEYISFLLTNETLFFLRKQFNNIDILTPCFLRFRTVFQSVHLAFPMCQSMIRVFWLIVIFIKVRIRPCFPGLDNPTVFYRIIYKMTFFDRIP